MIIRKYRDGDTPALAELFYDTVHSVNARDYTEEQLDVWATGNIDIAKWSREFSLHNTLVAETDSGIVGFSDMDRGGYLDRLYVHREHQGEGIASALVEQLEREAAQSGISSFEVHASITAKAFFERRGYFLTKENVVIKNGVPLINYIMTKNADGAAPENSVFPHEHQGTAI